MIDEETKSLWSQLLGKAMDGELKGTKLKLIPSVLTDWSSWRREHPRTTVLSISRTGREFKRDFYKDPTRFVVGISQLSTAKAWPFDQLMRHPLVNDDFDGRPIVVYFQPESSAVFIYDRTLGGRVLTFRQSGNQIVDNETNSKWNMATGRAIAGLQKGASLIQVPGIPSFKKSWENFFPESEIWKAD